MVTIRHADKTDYAVLPSVEADAAQVFKEYGLAAIAEMEPAPPEYYSQLPERAAVFVAEDEAVIGFAVITEIDGQAYLKEISVCRTSSGKGVGRTLLEHAISWAAARYRWMVLTTFADLPFNAPFYRKAGFQEFMPDDDWPELKALRMAEQKSGLDLMPRVTMRREISNG